jgi:uncharacterized protein
MARACCRVRAEDLPRDVNFLFSRNSLNVAISRARALAAVVVASPHLLDVECKTAEHMRLVNGFVQVCGDGRWVSVILRGAKRREGSHRSYGVLTVHLIRGYTTGDMAHDILAGVDLGAICRKYGIRKLSLFGSTQRGTRRRDSDVDLLVEFLPGTTPTYLDLATIEAEISEILGGVRVDVRTPAELSRYFRDGVIREAEVQYAAE